MFGDLGGEVIYFGIFVRIVILLLMLFIVVFVNCLYFLLKCKGVDVMC